MAYPSDLTDDLWDLLEPAFHAPGRHGRRHADDLRTVVGRVAVHRPDRLSVALSSGVVRAVDSGLNAVSRLVAQRHLGASPDGAARGRTPGGREGGRDGLDDRHRHPSGAWCLQRRIHLPRPRQPLRAHQGRQACRGGGRDRPSGGRSGGASLDSREPGQRADVGEPAPSGTPGASRCPRPPRPLPPHGEVVREHHHRGDRLAPGSPASPRRCAISDGNEPAGDQSHWQPEHPPARTARNAACPDVA
jgi:hypothetical protein